ncbi:hypothetical protein HMI54_012659 [Coelomomyces lativittatus]|nr:hypothetical protein HMI55_006760 [Coelomomyces lativittatus]KAJ1514272.1 hypothetical protein HMI56_000803 [Coelomomyces lativittatus]KAJ1515228.1 hypothetical protein HMI54_012659 [Coelomomyces lativittatus]
MTAFTSTPSQSILNSFFSHFPLLKQSDHQLEILKYSLGIFLELFSATFPSSSSFDSCSLSTFEKHALLSLQRLQASTSNEIKKHFDDPFHVYPNWWGNSGIQTLEKSQTPRTLPEVLEKWGMSSSKWVKEKTRNLPKQNVHMVPSKTKPKQVKVPQKSARDETTQTFFASPPLKPMTSSKPSLRSPPSKSFFVPVHPPPTPSHSKPSSSSVPNHAQTPLPPTSFHISTAPLKSMLKMAHQCTQDPIFQYFQTHSYLDEVEAQPPAKEEWYKREWIPKDSSGTREFHNHIPFKHRDIEVGEEKG